MSLRLEMHDAQGVKLEAASDHTYLHGGYGEMLPALEHALEGKAPGESVELQLEPEDASASTTPICCASSPPSVTARASPPAWRSRRIPVFTQ